MLHWRHGSNWPSVLALVVEVAAPRNAGENMSDRAQRRNVPGLRECTQNGRI